MSDNPTVPFNPCNRHGKIIVTKRNLPHWEQPCGCYFITFRLADSLPQNLITELAAEKKDWLKNHPQPWSEVERIEHGQRFTKREEQWLDSGYGACHLRVPEIRDIISSSLNKFDGIRYEIDCFVLMPNHVHLIWQMKDEFKMRRELRLLKGGTARYCNEKLNRQGTFWMDESYDRLVRDKRELNTFRNYIEGNPTKAALSENEFFLQMNHRLTVC